MFEVGGRYANRNGEYTVLELNGPKMTVRYDGGETSELRINVQERIWENIVAERDALSARRSSRSQARPNQGVRYYIKTIVQAAVEELVVPGWKEQVLLTDPVAAELHSGDRLLYYIVEKQAFLAVGTVTGNPAPPQSKDYFYNKQAGENVHVFPIDFDLPPSGMDVAVEVQSVELESQANIKNLLQQAERYIQITEDEFELLSDLLTELVEEQDDDDIDDNDEDFED